MKPKNTRSLNRSVVLFVDLNMIEQNVRVLNKAARSSGIEIVGVVKGVLGDLRVAEVMIGAGIKILADSRIENLERLKMHFSSTKVGKQTPNSNAKKQLKPYTFKLYALRQPLTHEIKKAVSIADIITCHSYKTAEDLNSEAAATKKRIDIVIPVDLGYGREGVSPDELPSLIDRLSELKNIRLIGIATISNCEAPAPNYAQRSGKFHYASAAGVRNQMKKLVSSSKKICPGDKNGPKFISGGNSGAISLLLDKKIPAGIKQLTIGESILIGRDTLNNRVAPGLRQDTFHLEVEVVQVRLSGRHSRILWGVGKQDIGAGELSLAHHSSNIDLLESETISSDHLEMVCDTKVLSRIFPDGLEAGQKINLYPDYFALLGLMVNTQIKKEYIHKNKSCKVKLARVDGKMT